MTLLYILAIITVLFGVTLLAITWVGSRQAQWMADEQFGGGDASKVGLCGERTEAVYKPFERRPSEQSRSAMLKGAATVCPMDTAANSGTAPTAEGSHGSPPPITSKQLADARDRCKRRLDEHFRREQQENHQPSLDELRERYKSDRSKYDQA